MVTFRRQLYVIRLVSPEPARHHLKRIENELSV
jgi:hypothetical protein